MKIKAIALTLICCLVVGLNAEPASPTKARPTLPKYHCTPSHDPQLGEIGQLQMLRGAYNNALKNPNPSAIPCIFKSMLQRGISADPSNLREMPQRVAQATCDHLNLTRSLGSQALLAHGLAKTAVHGSPAVVKIMDQDSFVTRASSKNPLSITNRKREEAAVLLTEDEVDQFGEIEEIQESPSSVTVRTDKRFVHVFEKCRQWARRTYSFEDGLYDPIIATPNEHGTSAWYSVEEENSDIEGNVISGTLCLQKDRDFTQTGLDLASRPTDLATGQNTLVFTTDQQQLAVSNIVDGAPTPPAIHNLGHQAKKVVLSDKDELTAIAYENGDFELVETKNPNHLLASCRNLFKNPLKSLQIAPDTSSVLALDTTGKLSHFSLIDGSHCEVKQGPEQIAVATKIDPDGTISTCYSDGTLNRMPPEKDAGRIGPACQLWTLTQELPRDPSIYEGQEFEAPFKVDSPAKSSVCEALIPNNYVSPYVEQQQEIEAAETPHREPYTGNYTPPMAPKRLFS